MRTLVTETRISLWASANDTYGWANKPGARWPCSQLSGHRFYAEFDTNGLCDLTVDGKYGVDIDATEFNACVSYLLRNKISKDHALHFLTVGQFE